MCVSDEGGDNFGGGGQLEHTLFVGGFGCCCSSAAHLEEARRACPHTVCYGELGKLGEEEEGLLADNA
uniref:Uncharacterized protein n=1 Tax=Oryza meridionalis TaxID=40149 RepID=A0A0E0EB60_9ORYZ